MEDYDKEIINLLSDLCPKFDKIQDLMNELIELRENSPKNEETELLFYTALAKILHNFGRYYLILNNVKLDSFEKKAEKLTKHLNMVRFEATLGKRLRINKNAVRNMFKHLITPIANSSQPILDSDDDDDNVWT